MKTLDAERIIEHFYPKDTPLRQLLLAHSRQVSAKAIEILNTPQIMALNLDYELVINGAMLHDIGIKECYAPKIFCEGRHHYIAHGVIGGAMLRELDSTLEPLARICERHTGSGLTAENIRIQNLPIPEQDFTPQSLEERLICYADKFFSKSGNLEEKSLKSINKSMAKFGSDSLERWEELCRLFNTKGA